MILVDTSLWVDHLGSINPGLEAQLRADAVLMHPFILGEIAMGNLRGRRQILNGLRKLTQIAVASPEEVLFMVESNRIWGSGIGYVDANLVASVRFTPGCKLWTRDRRLAAVADRLGVNHQPLH